LHLQRIIDDECVDLLIPTCEEVMYVGRAKERLETHVFAESFDRLDQLHNKWKFYQYLVSLGLPTPHTALCTGQSHYSKKHVLKPVYSRFAAKATVVKGRCPPIQSDPSNPWIAQEYIEGEKLCTYSVCHQGRVCAHGVYRVLHSMGMGSAICFESVSAPDVDDFVRSFVGQCGFTGQIAFDFIRGDKLYCLECNPRATSGIHLFKRSPELAQAFLKPVEVAYPQNGMIFHEHLFMLWYGLKQRELFSTRFWSHFFRGSNPLWARGDLRVLRAMPYMLLEAACRTLVRRQGFNQAMSCDIEYNGP
jgi:predicted ATP-grasp superfamily ATP-dependent carboligase